MILEGILMEEITVLGTILECGWCNWGKPNSVKEYILLSRIQWKTSHLILQNVLILYS
jgi:hypothetical protein